jgi:hypothetical protein
MQCEVGLAGLLAVAADAVFLKERDPLFREVGRDRFIWGSGQGEDVQQRESRR